MGTTEGANHSTNTLQVALFLLTTVFFFPLQFALCIFKFNFLAFRKPRKKRTHGRRVITMYPDRHRQVPSVVYEFKASVPEALSILGQVQK